MINTKVLQGLAIKKVTFLDLNDWIIWNGWTCNAETKHPQGGDNILLPFTTPKVQKQWHFNLITHSLVEIIKLRTE